MRILPVLAAALLFAGCQTAPVRQTSQTETVSALTTMTTGLTGQALSEEDLKKAAAQIQKDPDAQSAVAAVAASFTQEPGDIKYCPVDGTRYSGNLTKCPKCGATLKPVQ